MRLLDQFEFSGAKEATLIPGVQNFLERIRLAGLPFGILTRNSRKVAEFTMDRFGIRPEILVSREDARPKPDPEGLELMLRRWDIAKEEAIFVGDYRFDLETGINAGVSTALYVPEREPEYAHLATHLFRNYSTLEKIVFG
jgi:HAD superfamily hydrolase (TIGR01549 family)